MRWLRLLCFMRGHTPKWRFEGDEFGRYCSTCGKKFKSDWKGRFW